MSTLPALDLADFRHPDCDEWVYGPRRTGWVGGHPITATADPAPGEPHLSFVGPLGLHADELPQFRAWVNAVCDAVETAVVERDAHASLVAATRVDDPAFPDLVDVDHEVWFWGRDDSGDLGYVLVRDGDVLDARSRAQVDHEYGPLTEQARPREDVA